MTPASTARPHTLSDPEPTGAAWQRLTNWTRRLEAWRLQRQTSRALLALSDAGLKDIGLHRSEVDSWRAGARRPPSGRLHLLAEPRTSPRASPSPGGDMA